MGRHRHRSGSHHPHRSDRLSAQFSRPLALPVVALISLAFAVPIAGIALWTGDAPPAGGGQVATPVDPRSPDQITHPSRSQRTPLPSPAATDPPAPPPQYPGGQPDETEPMYQPQAYRSATAPPVAPAATTPPAAATAAGTEPPRPLIAAASATSAPTCSRRPHRAAQ